MAGRRRGTARCRDAGQEKRKGGRRRNSVKKEKRETEREREGSGLCRGAAYRGLENALFRLHSHRLGMGVSRA